MGYNPFPNYLPGWLSLDQRDGVEHAGRRRHCHRLVAGPRVTGSRVTAVPLRRAKQGVKHDCLLSIFDASPQNRQRWVHVANGIRTHIVKLFRLSYGNKKPRLRGVCI